MRRRAIYALLAVISSGCVERTLTIQSSPPGAMVTLNDMEIGRTPVERQFVWYGTFDAQVRLDGYQTINTRTPVIAPWWQWIGFDLIAELLPIRLQDRHTISYRMAPQSQAQVDPEAIMLRAQGLREQLENSRLPASATQPATRPSKKKSAKAATRPN